MTLRRFSRPSLEKKIGEVRVQLLLVRLLHLLACSVQVEISRFGCSYKLGVLFVGDLIIGALLSLNVGNSHLDFLDICGYVCSETCGRVWAFIFEWPAVCASTGAKTASVPVDRGVKCEMFYLFCSIQYCIPGVCMYVCMYATYVHECHTYAKAYTQIDSQTDRQTDR